VFDGVDELDAVGPYEVFANGERAGAPIEVRLVTLEDCGRGRRQPRPADRPDGAWDG